ncbi:MAG: long-chain fatty acid--CoA ligase [candidate division KSB1 bacterium]|nr:long-chain fatty acid--CoA ligase [candidate division KSB1 bacterium]
MNEQSVYHLFRDVCEKNSDKIAFRYKKDDRWIEVTWREHQETCKSISKSLMALGVQKGDKVNILSQTRLEWIQCDFGIIGAGATTVGIYPTLLPDEAAYIINHSDGVLIFVENDEQLQKVLTERDKLKQLKHIVIFDGSGKADNGVMSWQEFLQKGSAISDEEFEERANNIQRDDLAAIVYTSGTTGVPKGAMLTHGNFVFTSWSAAESLYLKPEFETLLFLPLAHVFARLIVHFCMRNALTINIAESIEKVADNLKETRPHFFASVPRIYEKVYEKITQGVEDAGGLKARLFNWALGVGYQVSELKQKKQSIPGGLVFKYKLATRLVFGKIQAALGGRIVWTVSGAAPLNVDVAKFFHACGILILEGIGMTENTSFTNVNRYDNYKFGTVGPPGPEIEQKIAPDGEILFRGKNVMKGYYKNPEATKETIDKDGWLYTGDVGEIDEDGFLRITDRKKDLIITAGGKNIAPQHVEKIIASSRYISQCMAYGDRKKYLVALITLDQEQVEAWATEQGVQYNSWEELAQHPKVRELIAREIEEQNKHLASFETIKKFFIVSRDFSIEGGELTPTLKVKRKLVTERFRKELEALYEAD